MRILGIDNQKCINCKQCVQDCVLLLFDEDKSGKIVFNDPNRMCISCGHCISVCPEDAILREKMDDVYTFPRIEDPEEIVSYESLYKLLRSKRSIRQFKKEKVPLKILEMVFEAMRYAPSGANRRSWRYKIISDSEKIKAISDAILQEFTQHDALQSMIGERFKKKQDLNIDPIFYNAPHIIIIYAFDNIDVDAGIAMTYGMLAAHSLGLGSCWIGFAKIASELNSQIKKLIGVNGKVAGVMALGYPDVRYYRCPPRSPLKIKGLK